MALDSTAAMYKNQKWREQNFMMLIRVGVKYFKRAHVISNISTLERFWELNKQAMDRRANRVPVLDNQFLDEHLIDRIKILICFENYIKGLLIKKGYIVHQIDKSVDRAKFSTLSNPFNTPLTVGEYKRIEKTYINPLTGNKTMRALKNKTLMISTLLDKPSYLAIHRIPISILNSINKFREERNGLHLKKTESSYVDDEYIKNIKEIISFVNKKLIKEHNRLVSKYNEPDVWERLYIEEIPI